MSKATETSATKSSASSKSKSPRAVMSGLMQGIRKLTPPKVALIRTPSTPSSSVSANPFVFKEEDVTKKLFCPALNCFHRLDQWSVLEHLQLEHSLVLARSTHCNAIEVSSSDFSPSSTIASTAWAPTLLSAFDTHFFLETCRHASGKWCMWVYHLGVENEGKEFVAEIEVFKDDDLRVHFTGPVHSLTTSQTKITSTGSCLVFCDAMAKHLLKPLSVEEGEADTSSDLDMGIAYRVRIRKKHRDQHNNDLTTHL